MVRRQSSQFLFQAFHLPPPARRRKSQFLFQAFRRTSLFLSQALCMSSRYCRRRTSKFLFQAFHLPTLARRPKSQFLFPQAFHLLPPVRRRKLQFIYQAFHLPPSVIGDGSHSFSSKLSIFRLHLQETEVTVSLPSFPSSTFSQETEVTDSLPSFSTDVIVSLPSFVYVSSSYSRRRSQFLFQASHLPTLARRQKSKFLMQAFHLSVIGDGSHNLSFKLSIFHLQLGDGSHSFSSKLSFCHRVRKPMSQSLSQAFRRTSLFLSKACRPMSQFLSQCFRRTSLFISKVFLLLPAAMLSFATTNQFEGNCPSFSSKLSICHRVRKSMSESRPSFLTVITVSLPGFPTDVLAFHLPPATRLSVC